jgi:non-homologous end joining protein Ku
MEMIEAQREGKEVVQPPVAAQGKVIDLMAALRASVAAAKERRRPEPATRSRRSRQAS